MNDSYEQQDIRNEAGSAKGASDETDIESPVFGASEFPEEEMTEESGDDLDAELEEEEEEKTAFVVRPWRVAKCLLALRKQVDRKAPGRSKLSDGTIGDERHRTRNSDHNPWVRDGSVDVVTALDITHDPGDGCDADDIAEAIRSSRDARVKYIIWNRRIASSAPKGGLPAWAWRPYGGENPHTRHIHISVKSDKARYDSTDSWSI